VSRIASPPWRLSHLYKFKPKSGGTATFRPNRYQRERFRRIYPKIDAKQPHKEIELKSRKFGTTTGCCFLCLDNTAYRPYMEAVTIAHKSEKSTEIFNNIPKFAWDRIPKELRPREKYNTKSEIDLSQSMRSKYIVSTDVKGTSPDILHISEDAYHEHDEAIKESLNALPPYGVCIAESTAHGVGNWFETTFSEAWAEQLAGKMTQWLPIFHPRFADPTN
jgi:hypothetical protein